MVIRELVTRLGFDADTATLGRWEKGITNLKSGLKAVALGASAAVGTLFGLALSTSNYAEALSLTATRLGWSTKALQEWQLAAKLNGGSAEALEAGLGFLSRKIGEVARGSKSATKDFKELGISQEELKRLSPAQVHERMMRAMGKMTNVTKRAAVAQEFYGRGAGQLMATLSSSPAIIDDARTKFRELGLGMSDEAIAASQDFNDTWALLLEIITAVKNEIGRYLIPGIQETVGNLIEWVRVNRELIRQRLEQFANAVTYALGRLWEVAKLVGNALTLLANNPVVAVFVALAAAFLSSWAAGLLLVAVIGLLVDDIAGWVQGQDSLIGRAIGPWNLFAQRLREIRDDVVATLATIKTAIASLTDWIPDLNLSAQLGGIMQGKMGGGAGVAAGGPAAPTLTPMGVPAPRSPHADLVKAVQKTIVQNNDVRVNVTVPAGTPEAQRAVLEQGAGKIAATLNRPLGQASAELARAE